MKLQKALTDHNFPQDAINIITSSGITDLYPPQAEAIEKGILKGKSLLMSVPTAAGKTLIAELCMVRSILQHQGRCLYIAPLKALASEKFKDFKKKYSSLGITVGLAIGDADSPTKHLSKYNIVVATAEKVDSIIRSRASWLINSLSVVVLDEIHFINDALRGPTMEILTARIKQLNPEIQILGLSATVQNADQMAAWLNSELVKSTWRPIPLKEGVYFNNQIHFEKHGTRTILEDESEDINKLTIDTLRGKGQVLIFVNSRRSAQAVSREVAKSVAKVLTLEEKTKLIAISKKIVGQGSEVTKICRKLGDSVLNGCAFHHAGLKPKQRELVEENFKANLIKVISCTPTLAAGVNLPARRAIIRDCRRFESGLGLVYIPTSEYKQCAGRAGRPQYDDYGEAILMAKSISETDTLLEKYIQADPEPVISKLDNESALRFHILASIAGGYVHDVTGMFDFIAHTFLYYQTKDSRMLDNIANIFDFLEREGFIEENNQKFFSTPLGNLTSRLYIDPATAIIIRNGLSLIRNNKTFSPIGILHMLTCTPDSPKMNVGKKDLEELESLASHLHDEFIFTPENWPELDDYYKYLSTLKTTWLLNQWIEEEREEVICDQFNTGPGDVYRFVESIQWLLYAAGNIAQLLTQKKLTFDIENLRTRLRYGVKEELLDLISLKGIGRIRARILFEKGFKDFNSLKPLSEDQLGSIKGIGKSLARDIVAQLGKPPRKTFSAREERLKQAAVADTNQEEWED